MSKPEEIIKQITTAIQDHKAEDVIVYKLNNPSIADFIIVVSVKNNIHCKSLVEHIGKKMKELSKVGLPKEFYKTPKLSGVPQSGWVVVDLNSVIIQVMCEEIRAYYKIDSLYENRAITFHE